ncbi:hypothetical protein [Winogradskyella tangerina]|uniref:hypothetical protein n=1 Tax=Winogradskyella tangerina TaxID=2023240 RepID=UPI000DBE53D4|nr:hypothetical protein [Winogradskyella tangerina]
MKYQLISLILLLSFSCENENVASIDSVKTDYFDQIPYLMHKKSIDSVAEIIIYGQLGTAKINDTLNYFRAHDNKTISKDFKSFMCCYDTFQFDSDGIVTKRTRLNCYTTVFDMSYNRKGDTIYVNETSNYNDSKIHKYVVKKDRVVSKSSRYNLFDDYSKEVRYFYNRSGQLIKKHSEAKNDPNGEFKYQVMLTSYHWNGKDLLETRLKQFKNDGKEYYETVTSYNSEGFPKATVVMENKDTICKTSIIKFPLKE